MTKRYPSSRLLLFAAIACAGVAVDLGSKKLVFEDLGYPVGQAAFQPGRHATFEHPANVQGRSTQYLDGWLKFELHTSFNEGALWGIGQGYSWLFAVASVAAMVGIVVWLFGFAAAKSRWLTVSLGLIMAGTIGNLWDRLGMHGCTGLQGEPMHAVRDFLLFTFGNYHYPIFNFADSFLVTGAIMLVVQSVFMPAAVSEKAVEARSAGTANIAA